MLYIPPINEILLAGKIKTRNIVWQEKTKYLYTSPKINIVRWEKRKNSILFTGNKTIAGRGKTKYCWQKINKYCWQEKKDKN
jgi:hypothetical protein